MAIRQIRRARDLARRDVPITPGFCVLHVRVAMDIGAATGDQDGDGDADAMDGWQRATRRVPVEGPRFWFRRGAPVWFAPAPADPDRHGHVAIATGYGRGDDAVVWSPGVPSAPGRWRKTTVGQLEAGWGLRALGYSLDLNGQPVPDLR